MNPLADAWDARVEALLARNPGRIADATHWLRAPSRRPVRIASALLLILGGCLSVLPVLGLWMLPLGLALLSDDVTALKPWLERSARGLERLWRRIRPPSGA